MKKLVASLMAFVMVVMSAFTVLGATKNDVQQKMDSSIKYAFDGNYGSDGYDFSNSKSFNIYLRAGGNAGEYRDDYMASVQSAIAGGTTDSGNIALAMQNYILMNAQSDELKNAFLAIPASAYYGYYLTYASQTASMLGEDELAKQICQKNADAYTMGVGTDFWGGYGTSADDLAMFVLCLTNGDDELQPYIDDALQLLEGYYTPQGYDNWGINADSTALALAVYSALGDSEKADKIYQILIDNFYDESTGGFKADYDPYYATADAVYGLSFYIDTLAEPEEPTTQEPTTQEATAQEATKDEAKTSPQTGSEGYAFVVIGVAAVFGAMAITAKRKKASNE